MENKKTCLYERHVALGAQMEPFAGFDMPIQYVGIIEEHQTVRTDCGVFDVSHMGEVTVAGKDAERYVNHLFTNDIADAPIGQVYYGMMCHENGGVVDDLLVYKMGEQDFLLVINAANTNKDWQWMQQQADGFDIVLRNESDNYGQIAIQGPKAQEVTEQVLGIECSDMTFFTARKEEQIIISRTGYTGEDGFEIYAAPEIIRSLWDQLLKSGRCRPCGLGCRDTLRFEVGLPLYGNELNADITPIMAGLSMFVKLEKTEFIGRDALVKEKNEGPRQRVVGIELNDRAIARHGYPVMVSGCQIGSVTTGYNSISTGKSVCMALVDSEYSTLGTEVEIQIRRKIFIGRVVKKRFYDKHYKK